jgi:hypothetical protein
MTDEEFFKQSSVTGHDFDSEDKWERKETQK